MISMAIAAPALATSVTVTDGKNMAAEWMLCDMKAPSRYAMTYYYAPIVPFTEENESLYGVKLMNMWQNTPVENNHMIYESPTCRKYNTKAEAESIRDGWKAKYAGSTEVQ
ncbi:hypothetical protein [Novosphingobium sp.]|uniref:hypothetical protein n=1 Tax=Novosphingobium sp. TaxID=1874826 RepID=UPI0035AF3A48